MPITQPPPGLGQFPDLIEPVAPMTAIGSTLTAALVANTVYLYRFRVLGPVRVGNGVVYNGATLGTAHLAIGVYTSDLTTWTLVGATADTAAAGANGLQTIPFVAPPTLVPGTDYWAAIGATDGTYTLLRAPSIVSGALGGLKNRSLLKAGVYAAGLPATITAPAGASLPLYLALTA